MFDDTDEVYTFVVPWSGEVPIPVPIPEGGPVPVGPAPIIKNPIPLPGNPVPYVVHGVEAAWSDVSDWVSQGWRAALGVATTVLQVTFEDVEVMIDDALTFEQQAWATFVNTLESWISDSVGFLSGSITDLYVAFTLGVLDIYNDLDAAIWNVLGWTLGQVQGIDQALARQWWDTVAGIENAVAGVRAWAIDNIYNPLLNDIWRVIELEQTDIANVERWFQTEIDNLNLKDIPGILAKLGVIAGTIAALQTWVDECGAPMCEQMGPNTDFSKLLKLLDIAGMLALLTAVGSLTEPELEQLAATVASIGADPASAFVDAFVTQGDTLATAILDTIPQLALP